ncbi:MAG TPA: BON domain-containing protein, partial [Candidatus Limnocylindrales bacterium]
GEHTGAGPKGYQRSDERIREDVSERLQQSGGIDAHEIEVAVDGGVVSLKGTVPDRSMKRMAEDAVDSCSGVKDVHNELRVESHEHDQNGGSTGHSGQSGQTSQTGGSRQSGQTPSMSGR